MFMKLVQMPECGGFDLTWADRLRKSIAKKNPAEYEELQKEYFIQVEEKGLSRNLCNYVWHVLVSTSRGYGFNLSHTLAYSLIALQEMNLAYKYPIMFWNCACLVADSGGAEEEESDNIININCEEEFPDIYYNEMEEFTDDNEDDVEDEHEEDEDCDDYPVEVKVTKVKKKPKAKANNYGKISSAIGKLKANKVDISAPDINKSGYTFSPDIEFHRIRFGLSGITRIGKELIRTIMDNRPYTSITDFTKKVKVNKPQMINLIKSGAFDSFGDRIDIMHQYVDMISDTKKRITLQNMKMLIDFGLIPDEYDLQRRVYNFNKYIKKLALDATYYGMDEIALAFYSEHFDVDKLTQDNSTQSGFKIKKITWDSIYQHHMDIIRPYVQKHAAELLVAVNNQLTHDVWEKYCLGTISKWEMDSISCYIHDHELAGIRMREISNYEDLPEVPLVERYIPIKGKMVPIFQLTRIMGTVLDRDKTKKTVTLLTTSGVVLVKVYGVFQVYDKQISERGADGKKHVLEKSVFARGNKIIVTGTRDGDSFLAKKYKNTPYHRIELIDKVKENGTLEVRTRGEE